MTSPRGWRISHLQHDLGIAPRTYRKYRRILQEDFHPFLRRDGSSTVIEVGDGDSRALRLRPTRELGFTSPDLEIHATAVHFANSLLIGTGVPELVRAGQFLVSDFQASLRDRDFLLNGVLADAPRMYVAESPEVGPVPFLAELIRAISNRRHVRIVIGEFDAVVAPLSLVLRHDGLGCVILNADDQREVDPGAIEQLEVLNTTFDYPTQVRYTPPV